MQALAGPLRKLIDELNAGDEQNQRRHQDYQQVGKVLFSNVVQVNDHNGAINHRNQPGQMGAINQPGAKIAKKETQKREVEEEDNIAPGRTASRQTTSNHITQTGEQGKPGNMVGDDAGEPDREPVTNQAGGNMQDRLREV